MTEMIFTSFLSILIVALVFLLVRRRGGRTTTSTSDSQVATPVDVAPPQLVPPVGPKSPLESLQAGPSQSDQGSPTQEQPPEQGATGPPTEPKPLTQKGKRPPPIKRGGKPRLQITSGSKETTEAEQRDKHIGKPGIVCRKVEQQWVLGVELPDDLLGASDLQVLQGTEALPVDERIENFWRLRGVADRVVISSSKGCWELGLNAESLIFKLYSSRENQGHLVKAPSVGSYLVVVPSDWQRDEHRSGPPLVEPEPVSIPGYRAHFFEITPSGGEIAFLKGDGNLVWIGRKPEIKLRGEQIPDANEFMGPLFRHPPRMCASPEVWKGIKEVILGEEGPVKGKWRMSFTPEPKDDEVILPEEIQRRKSGWYFLRFYDANDNLIDSLDFRFVSGLIAIRMPALNPCPARDGHQPVSIEIFHEPGIRIRPADSAARDIRVDTEDERTTLIVPPDPRGDKSEWEIQGDTGSPVKITLLVERIWWNFGEENSVPAWTDKVCDLTPDDFRAASKKALWIRLPKRRWVDWVKVGFAEAAARPYSVKVTEEWISSPLRDFTDCHEIWEGDKDHAFYVWFEKGATQYRGTVGLLRAWQKRILCSARGRYKSSVAIARIRQGNGEIRVNGQNLWEYFKSPPRKGKDFMQRLLHIEQIAQALSQLSVDITVHGARSGGLRQIKASVHALARALWSYQPGLKPVLRQQGFGGCKKIRGGSL